MSSMSSARSQKAPPHFVNDVGVEEIRIGVKAFKCIGASPPMDHPHIFLEMGLANEIFCPYCSTKFVFDKKLSAGEAEPLEAIYQPDLS